MCLTLFHRASEGQIVAVAETGEDVQFGAGSHFAHLLGARANHLVDNGQGFGIVVADGNGTAQELAGQLNIHKLAGCGDGGGIALQNHFIDRIRQRSVA